jgi:signal transduction histidine kinase
MDYKHSIEHDDTLQCTLKAIADGVCLLDNNYLVKDLNESFFRLVKKVTQRKIGRGDDFRDFILSSFGESHRLYKLFVRGMHGDVVKEQEYFLQGDRTYYYDISISPVSNDGLIISIHEVTREKRIERRLKDRLKELKHVTQDLDRFLYSVSHDLRAPLLSIQGLINNMRTELNENTSRDLIVQYIDYFDKSIKRLDNFTLDITRYTLNAQAEERIEQVDLEVLVHASIESLAFIESSEIIDKSLKIIN